MSAMKMEVVKITTKSGSVFYSADHGPKLMAEIMSRCQWETIELIEMTAKEYQSIPATNESARLFGA